MAEENGMTNEEVIESLSEIHQYVVGCYQNAGGTRACEQFDRYMRVVNGVKGLLTPVKPTFRWGRPCCGNCGLELHRTLERNNFCPNCGKAVDWWNA